MSRFALITEFRQSNIVYRTSRGDEGQPLLMIHSNLRSLMPDLPKLVIKHCLTEPLPVTLNSNRIRSLGAILCLPATIFLNFKHKLRIPFFASLIIIDAEAALEG